MQDINVFRFNWLMFIASLLVYLSRNSSPCSKALAQPPLLVVVQTKESWVGPGFGYIYIWTTGFTYMYHENSIPRAIYQPHSHAGPAQLSTSRQKNKFGNIHWMVRTLFFGLLHTGWCNTARYINYA